MENPFEKSNEVAVHVTSRVALSCISVLKYDSANIRNCRNKLFTTQVPLFMFFLPDGMHSQQNAAMNCDAVSRVVTARPASSSCCLVACHIPPPVTTLGCQVFMSVGSSSGHLHVGIYMRKD